MRVMIRAAVVVSLLLALAGCGDGSDQRADDEPEVVPRSLPPNICDWVPREHLTGLLVNEPTNSDVLGVPTSICTAVSKKSSGESRYVNVILKRFESVDEAREDNTEACRTFEALAPTVIEAPGVDAVATCARRNSSSTYLITVPNDSGDTLLVSLGGTSPAKGLVAATDITNNIARQLG